MNHHRLSHHASSPPPRATYRLQLTPHFGVAQLVGIVDYLALLGVSHVYLSPIMQACAGSLHGYDMTDPRQLNTELGSEEAFETLSGRLKELGMGWVQDFVPNHMALSGENPLLMDLFENGTASAFRPVFDVNWEHPYEMLRGRVLIPILGSFYGETLESGQLRLSFDERGFALCYWEHRLPLCMESYPLVLEHRLEQCRQELGAENPDLIKLVGVLHALKNLEGSHPPQRTEQVQFIKSMLWELYNSNGVIGQYINNSVQIFNGICGEASSFNLLDELHGRQIFRLSYWRVASEELNYRRFFTINSLISLRVEDEGVFDVMHRKLFELVRRGWIDGVRIDHIDGLYDPATYLNRLRSALPQSYVVVEKILAREESIPHTWPVQGTTGYDFMNYVNGLFFRRAHIRQLESIYRRHVREVADFEVLIFEKKRLIIGKHMAGDVDNLALLMKRISSLDRNGIDITLYGLRRALVDILANFPVYRTYVNTPQYRPEDRAHLESALKKARERNPGLVHEFDFIQKFLLLSLPDYVSQQERDQWLNFVMRFQQYCGPLMAKGLEDTTLYIYNRLISLNEVGGWPQNPGVTLRQFHAFNHDRALNWPASLSATATHDTKRGEDVRARINVLSEIPAEWGAQVGRWFALNRGFKRGKGRAGIPDANDEYHLYQTLVGSWPCSAEQEPLYRQRLQEYMVKAVREAKVHTAWIKPDSTYEDGLRAFIEAVVDEQRNREFFELFRPFVRNVSFYGMLNSLSQLMLKLTLPGVADIYQGCELWDFSLVDPDNRRAVDYTVRAAMLQQIRLQMQQDSGACIRACYQDLDSGRIKMFLLHRLLQARADFPELFAQGDYIPLKVQGRAHNNLCAFARTSGGLSMVVLVPRFYTALSAIAVLPLEGNCWGDTVLQIPYKLQGEVVEFISGRPLQLGSTVAIAEVLGNFPVALLISQSV